MKRWALNGLVLAALGLSALPAVARDNFLIIIADDFGVDKVAVYSRDDLYGHPGEGASPPPTPTIDALAAGGVLFRNAYANPVCSPTRAAMLTGRYGLRTGIGVPANPDLPLSELLIPEVLGGTHASGALGKWHLSPLSDLSNPGSAGFDQFAGTIAGLVPDYFSWRKITNGSAQTNWPVYATTDSVNEAIAAIQDFGDTPWFVWLAFHAPHSPFHVPPSDLHSQLLSGNPNASAPAHYAAAVEAMDSEIARLLASIDSAVRTDTTIIFVGDNGTPNQAVEAPFIAGRAKGTVYEGGINVPFIVSGPHVPAEASGSESLALVHVVDAMATLADITGNTNPGDDSLSLLPYLQDPTLATRAERNWVYSESFSPNGFGPYVQEERGLRDAAFKLIWRNGTYEEMFALETDPFEQTNLLLGTLTPTEQASLSFLTFIDSGLHGTLTSLECGDLDQSGVADPDDVLRFRQALAAPALDPLNAIERHYCSLKAESTDCAIVDVAALTRTISDLDSGTNSSCLVESL